MEIQQSSQEIIPDEDFEIKKKGFDRGVDYKEIKQKLLMSLTTEKNSLPEKVNLYKDLQDIRTINRMIKILIALIQLRNGSRIQEACSAFYKFYNDKSQKSVRVILAKSKKNGPLIKSNARDRKMFFPSDWFDFDVISVIKRIKLADSCIRVKNLKKSVLDYMLNYHSCNTHSLRYAFINHKISDDKVDINIVAKMVGHRNLSQILTYTSSKKAEECLEKD